MQKVNISQCQEILTDITINSEALTKKINKSIEDLPKTLEENDFEEVKKLFIYILQNLQGNLSINIDYINLIFTNKLKDLPKIVEEFDNESKLLCDFSLIMCLSFKKDNKEMIKIQLKIIEELTDKILKIVTGVIEKIYYKYKSDEEYESDEEGKKILEEKHLLITGLFNLLSDLLSHIKKLSNTKEKYIFKSFIQLIANNTINILEEAIRNFTKDKLTLQEIKRFKLLKKEFEAILMEQIKEEERKRKQKNQKKKKKKKKN